jgi:predicted transposase/invertase (TIGR01784 family)
MPPISSDAPLLDPKNDYVFKRLFAQRIDLLTDLVNLVRGGTEPLQLTEVLNPHILPEDITGKQIVLDVRALDTHGRSIDVEVQVRAQRDYSARALYYLARSLVDQIGESEAYSKLRSVIGVNILDFHLFREPGDEARGQWRFAMRADPQPDQLGQPDQPPRPPRELEVQLELNFLELPKLAQLGLEKTNKPLYDWCLFFSNPNGVAMEQITHPSVKEAFAVLKSVSATAEERADAEKRIKYVRDLNAMIGAGWDEGRAAGKAEGKAELLERQLTRKFGALPDALRNQLMAATDDELNEWSEAVLIAKTLGEVFSDT